MEKPGGRRKALAYGISAFSITLVHNVFLLYHIEVFARVFRIDEKWFYWGQIAFLTWNSINDGVLGWLADKDALAEGSGNRISVDHGAAIRKRLRGLRLGGPGMALAFLLMWIDWGAPGIQMVICLCLYDGFLTWTDLSHSALLADLAVETGDRAQMNSAASFFSVFATASVFVSYIYWVPDVDHMGPFVMFCLVLSVMSAAGFIGAAHVLEQCANDENILSGDAALDMKSSAPAITPVENPGVTRTVGLMEFVSQIVAHRNLMWFMAMQLIQVFHCHFNSNFFPVFLEHLLRGTLSPVVCAVLLGFSFVAPHVNNVFFSRLCKTYGTYAVVRALFVTKFILAGLVWLAGPASLYLIMLYIVSNRVFSEGTCKLIGMVTADLADEDAVLHNRRGSIAALIFGVTNFVSKPGQTLAPLLGIWALSGRTDLYFQDANGTSAALADAGLDAAGRSSMFSLLVLVPFACGVAQFAIWTRFTLHGERLARVKHLLIEGATGADLLEGGAKRSANEMERREAGEAVAVVGEEVENHENSAKSLHAQFGASSDRLLLRHVVTDVGVGVRAAHAPPSSE